MNPISYSLGGGAAFRAVKTDRFKAGFLTVFSVLPFNRENACMAPLMLSVLRRGTERYPALADLNRRLDELFGTGFSLRNFCRGDWMVIGFSAELLDNSYLPKGSEDLLDGVTEILGQILYHPLLDENGLLLEKYVESEKIQQCDTIRAAKNSPRSYAIEKCRSILYENEPFALPMYGTEEETMAVTREELTAYWKKFLASFCPDCFYVGQRDPEAIKEKLEKTLIAGRPLPQKPLLPAQTVFRGRRKIRRQEETLEVSQGQLVIGFRTGILLGDPDFCACTVMNELLGVSPISRLFTQVREKMSLCYSCSSSYSAFKGGLVICCGLDVANRKIAEREILKQVKVLADGTFTDEEFEAAKKSVDNAYRQLEDSPEDLENYFFGRSLMKEGSDPAKCREMMRAVTRDDVIRVAKKMKKDTVFFLRGTLTGGGEEDDDGTEI